MHHCAIVRACYTILLMSLRSSCQYTAKDITGNTFKSPYTKATRCIVLQSIQKIAQREMSVPRLIKMTDTDHLPNWRCPHFALDCYLRGMGRGRTGGLQQQSDFWAATFCNPRPNKKKGRNKLPFQCRLSHVNQYLLLRRRKYIPISQPSSYPISIFCFSGNRVKAEAQIHTQRQEIA